MGATGYSDTGLEAGTEYFYQVSAYDEAGVESFRQEAVRATTPAAGQVLAGDVNNDRVVNLEDEILVLQVLADEDPGPLNIEAEVNNDARLGLAEAIFILREVSR